MTSRPNPMVPERRDREKKRWRSGSVVGPEREREVERLVDLGIRYVGHAASWEASTRPDEAIKCRETARQFFRRAHRLDSAVTEDPFATAKVVAVQTEERP